MGYTRDNNFSEDLPIAPVVKQSRLYDWLSYGTEIIQELAIVTFCKCKLYFFNIKFTFIFVRVGARQNNFSNLHSPQSARGKSAVGHNVTRIVSRNLVT